MGIDEALLHAINQPGVAALDWIMIALSSRWFSVPVLLALGIYLALRSRWRWRAAVLLGAAVLITDFATARLAKPLVARVRPCAEKPPRSVTLQGCGRGQSLPSGHSANAGAAAMVLGWAAPQLAVPGAVLAFLIGASRVYLGQHWPSDVLAGWAWGAVLAGALIFALRKWPGAR